MQFPSKGQMARRRLLYPAGTRIESVQMNGAQTPPVGTCGTVIGVDDTGSITVDWDNGSGPNIIYSIGHCKGVSNE